MHDNDAETTRRGRPRGSAGAALLVVLTLLASSSCDTLHPEELDCEEAVAYYQKCCPTPPSPAIRCVDSVPLWQGGFGVDGPGGGGGVGSTPDISELQSACLRAMSCEELVAGGYCAAASAFLPSNANATLFPPPLGCQTPPPATASLYPRTRSAATPRHGGYAVATSADAPTTSPMLALGAVALALLLRRRRSLALAPAVLVWLWPRAAIAQELPSQTVAPPPVAPEPTASPAAAADAPRSYRLAAVGTFYNVFDLHAWGAGAEASLVVDRNRGREVHADLRFIQEQTFGGVFLEDASAGATVEFLLGSSGLRVGAGVGAMYLLVRRATTASFIAVPGLDASARFGYDAGLANRPFVMAELEVRAPLGALAWGPTLQAGWRF